MRRSARDCRDCPGHETTHSGTQLHFFIHVVIYKDFRLYLGHDGVSSFACDAIEAAQDLQHKRPGGMEAIGQSFFYDAGTHTEETAAMIVMSRQEESRIRLRLALKKCTYRNILQT